MNIIDFTKMELSLENISECLEKISPDTTIIVNNEEDKTTLSLCLNNEKIKRIEKEKIIILGE